MTHPPATCELCGDTGLYSPSALPCPKGCSAEDTVDRLNEIWSTDDHERGCQGREYSCSCGFDDRTFATAKSAAEYITNLRQALSEAEQREKDARAKALEDAAHVAFSQIEAPGLSDNPAYVSFEPSHVMARKIALLIGALKDEVR